MSVKSTIQEERFAVYLHTSVRDHLTTISKRHKITQGEVLETLLALYGDTQEVKDIFDQKRVTKVANRQPKKELFSKLRSLTPEQILAIEAMTQNNKLT